MMQKAYGQLRIGNPLDQQNHVGPLIDRHAVEIYLKALEQIKVQGGRMLVEGGVIEGQNIPADVMCVHALQKSRQI